MSSVRETLLDWDSRYVWHPFTPHSAYPSERPLVVTDAEGHELIDADGRRLLDGVGSLWCNLFGHRHPRLDAALRHQLDRVAHATLLGNTCEAPIRLAKRLVELTPDGLDKVFFSDSGSTAVEVALKMALQFWQQQPDPAGRQRTRYLSMRGAYHGDTVGSVSVGGIDLFHQRFGPLLFEVMHGPSSEQLRSGLDRAAFAERYTGQIVSLIREHGDELAAVIVEPGMQGAAGMLEVPAGFLAAVRAACDEVGTLLIADEVAMGLGRGGALVSCSLEDVVPDFLCLAKGLTGGYLPLAATLTSDRIYEAFLGPPEEGRTFFHGHTYTGNALGSAVAIEALELLLELLPDLPARIATLRERLAPLADHPRIGQVRQFGLAAGVELVADKADLSGYPASERRGMQVCTAANARGVFLRPLGDVIVLMPALTFSDHELGRLVEVMSAAIDDACA